jgi:hypothetical protein
MLRARITPPAGPLSTRRTGKRRAVSTVQTPPEDIISSSGQVAPRPRNPSCMPARYSGHQRQHIGVGDRGRGALVFADFAAHLGRYGDRQIRQCRGDARAGAFLMRRIDVGVQEADRHRLDLARLQSAPAHPAALRPGPAARRRPPPAAPAPPAADRARPAAPAVPYTDRIVRTDARRRFPVSRGTLCGDQGGLGPLALDQRVGGQRRAVDHQIERGRCHPGLGQDGPRAVDDRRSGASCVVSSLREKVRSGNASTRSVKVPPISTASRVEPVMYVIKPSGLGEGQPYLAG